MNVKIGLCKLAGQVSIISSKSDVHRLLIASALAETPTKIVLDGWSDDMEATTDCLTALGAEVERSKNMVLVNPIDFSAEKEAILDCMESGSTLRFLLPIVGALGRSVLIEGRGRLPQRPIGVLLNEMCGHGVEVDNDRLPLVMKGQMTAGVYTLPGNISSQFITGLLMALPLLEGDSEIRLTTAVESVGYIRMTLQVVRAFGIEILEIENGYKIKGGQRYQSPGEITAEGDWSSAAFWLAAGAVSNEITCSGLNLNSCQADQAIVPLLRQFGAEVIEEGNQVTVRPGKLRGIRVDASQIPDLVPILCAIASQAKGRTVIYNAGRLRIKESDRLKAMADGLSRIGVLVQEKPEGLIIEGGSNMMGLQDVYLDTYNDHRIVMALAITAMAGKAIVVLTGAEAVNKSYPGFFADFVKLGGVADVL